MANFLMDDKQRLAFFHASIPKALEAVEKLGDMGEYLKKFRGCFADGLSDFSDTEVIFAAGFVAGVQAVVEEVSEDLEEMSAAAKHREMFVSPGCGRG